MINYDNENKKAVNTKTGNWGFVICEYNRTTDNRPTIEVKTITGRKAHWNAKYVSIK